MSPSPARASLSPRASPIVAPVTAPGAAPAPHLGDAGRLAVLRATGLLDGVASPVLDQLTRLATRLTHAPVALVSLVDAHRQHFPGLTGLGGWAGEARGVPLSHSFCQHVVASAAPLVVDDATVHPLLCDNAAITDFGFVAYLGVPLTTPEGATLGAFCVIDTQPHAWTEADQATLHDLGAAVLSEITLRASETRFRLAVEATQEVVYAHDCATGYVSREGAVEAIYGRPAAELSATSDAWLGLIHPDDRARVAASWQAALDGGAPRWSCEYRLRRPDGSVAIVRDRARILCDARGQPQRIAGAVTDVTEQRLAEEALRTSEARLSGVIGSAMDAILTTDAADRIVLVNAAAERLFGYPAAELTGTPIARLIPTPIQTRDIGVTGRRRDGREFPIEGSISEVVTNEGRFHSVILRDITERREIEAARAALETRLRQAQKMEAVGQLAGGVAHDFNNLLTIIGGNLEFVQHDLPAHLPADHPVRVDLEEIGHAAERARTLVRQLLAFSRQQPVRPQLLRVGHVVHEAERLLRRVIGEEITLTSMLDDADAVVRMDPGQLEQVLMNLAVNARDAMLTPLHGHPGTGGTLGLEVSAVTLSAADAAGWDDLAPGPFVRLRVCDTGHGMDAATQARVFEPFFTTKPVGSGTGLGLATVFGIVRGAGGAIHVESAPGCGTTFTILVPAAERTVSDGTHVGRAVPAAGAQATFLLVEDETAVRATLRRVLERRGYVVLEARHGADALLLWRDHHARIDGVVTDLRMPELGGRELVALLRVDAPTLPVVYVSGYSERGTEVAPGAPELFVEKPFTAETLLTAVSQVLRQAAALRA